jgi:hypothetical protein
MVYLPDFLPDTIDPQAASGSRISAVQLIQNVFEPGQVTFLLVSADARQLLLDQLPSRSLQG